jgi:hypothetical protein
MSKVIATATGGTNSFGVSNESSSPTMTDVIASGTGGTNNFGVSNESSSSPTMTNVTATATGGTNNYGVFNTSSSSPSIRNSSITGGTNSISNSSSTALVADTMLNGAVSGASFTCLNTYTETFSTLDEDCAVIP